MLDNILENNEKVLIFTQLREMGLLLQEMIQDRFGTESMFLHGGTSRKKRDEMVERFQNDAREKIFLLLNNRFCEYFRISLICAGTQE